MKFHQRDNFFHYTGLAAFDVNLTEPGSIKMMMMKLISYKMKLFRLLLLLPSMSQDILIVSLVQVSLNILSSLYLLTASVFFTRLMVIFMTATGPAAFACCPC